jgi:hypothetical protein
MSAKSCHSTGLANVDGLGLGLVPPTGMSCHCWLVPPWSSYWTMLAPSAVEAFWTSSALLLCREMNRTWPSLESASRHCWLVPFPSAHWTMAPPLAVEKL